jgi:hypothetical protein
MKILCMQATSFSLFCFFFLMLVMRRGVHWLDYILLQSHHQSCLLTAEFGLSSAWALLSAMLYLPSRGFSLLSCGQSFLCYYDPPNQSKEVPQLLPPLTTACQKVVSKQGSSGSPWTQIMMNGQFFGR